MRTTTRQRIVLAVSAAALAVTLSACGDDSDDKDTSKAKSTPTAMQASAPFGDACSAVPATGEGSFDGMSNDPVATAASNNPVLSTLVTAVTKANLADTLNGAENITVFAPANAAFEKVPAADLQALLNDDAALKSVLTYHVVGERITPDKLSDGTFKTLQGAEVKATGSGTDLTINGSSKVICGNVQTANATVYIIDTVLMPS